MLATFHFNKLWKNICSKQNCKILKLVCGSMKIVYTPSKLLILKKQYLYSARLDSAFSAESRAAFSLFFFFFLTSRAFQGTTSTIAALFITVHTLKNIKNGSHDTIHTFKIYFAIVLSVFSFQFLISVTISSIQMDP